MNAGGRVCMTHGSPLALMFDHIARTTYLYCPLCAVVQRDDQQVSTPVSSYPSTAGYPWTGEPETPGGESGVPGGTDNERDGS